MEWILKMKTLKEDWEVSPTTVAIALFKDGVCMSRVYDYIHDSAARNLYRELVHDVRILEENHPGKLLNTYKQMLSELDEVFAYEARKCEGIKNFQYA